MSKPVNVLAVPAFTVSELAGAGARRISLGSSLATYCYGMLQTASQSMLENGSFEFTRSGMPFGKLQGLFAVK